MRSGDIRADLDVPEIGRSYQSKSFTCEASNNKQTQPLHKKIGLSMNLRPLSAKIKLPSEVLVAGKTYSFSCESHGSKPSAVISWQLDSQDVGTTSARTHSPSEDVTTGTLSLTLHSSDNQKVLLCQAQNPSIAGSTISDTVKLDVQYMPVVALQLGSSLDPSQIKQGDDVYFECLVDSNPAPYKIAWFRNDQEIVQNMSSGILVTSKSLVLQSVSRGGAGQYTCAATNTQGNATSNPVKLAIMYAPECMVDQPAVLAVGKGERVNISCRVASNPLRATFHWKLNGSERTYSKYKGISSHRGQLVSHYSFLGTSDKDYGSLLCWANNSVGVQQKACVFTIIPAGPPSPPEGCEILNNTAENIEVACLQGFDGGVGQHFMAEIFDESGSLHLNRTSDEPQFSVQTLEPGKTYVIRISAFNAKGRSQTVSLTASTLKVAEKRMGETKPFIYSPLIAIFLGIVGVFVVLILLLVFITRWRRNVTSGSSAPISRIPSPPPATKASSPVKPLEEPPRDGALKKPTTDDDDAAPSKPKKRVMVLENGRVERTGVGDSPIPDTCVKESIPAKSSSFSGPLLPNGSTGYYDSLSKSSYSPGFSANIMSLSPSSSGTSSPAFPISNPHVQTTHRNYPRISMPPVNALSPLPEEYGSRSAYSPSHHVSTLPRSRDQYDSLIHHAKDPDNRRTPTQSPYRNTLAGVGERYHLMQEVKANPKYVVRRGIPDLDDESFV
ncbi:neuronal cell adhesion molecule [Hyalella azteca]|uniref:Neuronal cell adhesion molecule n=1 Tax=Hyalella azteca TaxID=294128 RepID=A0A8B7NQ57_HYAAZ|nr:neuronal cell adhesion molecule [Hyalella azteca]